MRSLLQTTSCYMICHYVNTAIIYGICHKHHHVWMSQSSTELSCCHHCVVNEQVMCILTLVL